MKKLSREFYNRNTLIVAQELLGKYLVNRFEDYQLVGKIVETEAYIGAIDKAAHCYNYKRTNRNSVMFGPPGYAYVFSLYGMYNAMNVVTEEEGEPAAVLIRGLEPVEGIEIMSHNRYRKSLSNLSKREMMGLSDGPGKLCIAMNITKDYYGEDLTGDNLFVTEEERDDLSKIASSKRINIDYAEEARDFMWRFYFVGNPFVSKVKIKENIEDEVSR